MQGEHYGNAMTEIALALAMAFFSLMILTMVSMGAGGAGEASDTANQSSAETSVDRMVGLMLAPPPDGAPKAVVERIKGEDRLVVFHNGRYLDKDLRPLDPATLPDTGRIILAVAPDLPLNEALAARSGIARNELTVTTLDRRWLDRLEVGVK